MDVMGHDGVWMNFGNANMHGRNFNHETHKIHEKLKCVSFEQKPDLRLFFVYFVCFVVTVFQWWQLPQLWDEHEPQDEPEEDVNAPPLFMPKTENFFFTSCA